MKSLEVKKDLYWVGAYDPDLRIFDIIMYTPYGTTYNSYVVRGSEKIAVFDTVKAQFFDQYIERLDSLKIDYRNIDYIVVSHTEPDHAGSVAKLLELSPKAKVIGSAAALKFLKGIANREFESIAVGDGDSISLGNKTLNFISVPFLHWPDTIYTHIPEEKTLITCDSFGTHYCFEGMYNDLIPEDKQEEYMESLRYYYDVIMGPFKPYVLKAYEKIKDLEIDLVTPGHGPILRENPWKIIELYKEWSTPVVRDKKKVTIPYVSAYGYTEQMANTIAEGIKSVADIEVKLYNVIYHDMKDIINDISESDGVLFGSPTIVSELLEPIRDLMAKLNPVIHGGKAAAAFGSYGWSGEAVPRINSRLKELKMNIYGNGLKINFKPSEDDIKECFDFGVGFANMMLGKSPEGHDDSSKKQAVNSNESNEVVADKNSEFQEIKTSGEVKLWKCIICGEIFESELPPEICPVCGAGSDQFEEVKVEKEAFHAENHDKFVIIGNGAAGFYAAKSIREKNPTCSIKILSKEEAKSYFRPQVSDLISGTVPDNKFYLAKDEWYKENNIEQILGAEVVDIKTKDKKVLLASGEEISYDKLILANGSYNFILPVKAGDSVLSCENYRDIKGIYTIKDMKDAINVREALNTSKNAIVIGGGLLGLEAAWEMHEKGAKVSVVEFFPRLLPKQLDLEGSKLFQEITSSSGIEIILGDSAEEIIIEDNKVKSIRLKSGKILDCDLLVFSVGIRSNIELPKKAGIAVDRGVKVNKNMETNVTDVYACGDIAELQGIVYGNWPAAIEMGKVAGTNAVGDKAEFKQFVSSVIFNALNARVFSAGTINFDDATLEHLSYRDDNKKVYKKIFFKDNKLIGGVLIGNIGASTKIISGIKKGITKEEALNNGIL